MYGLKLVPKEPYLATSRYLRGQPSSKKRNFLWKDEGRISLEITLMRQKFHHEIFGWITHIKKCVLILEPVRLTCMSLLGHSSQMTRSWFEAPFKR